MKERECWILQARVGLKDEMFAMAGPHRFRFYALKIEDCTR